jgi:hypothetical protein
MNIEDYVHPDDPHAPRPRASQAVAAAKRAQRLDDPEPLTPVVPARRYVPFGVGALLLIVLMIGAASYQLAQLPSAKPLQITPVPTAAAQAFGVDPKISPVASQEARTAPTVIVRTIGAYAAPDGVLLGQVEETRQIVPVAHSGSDWVQADVSGSGLVWLRASDVPHLAIIGPDLAPQPQGRGLTISNDWTPPEPTPVPPAEPTAAPEWPTSAPDPDAPNIKEHFNVPHASGQDG